MEFHTVSVVSDNRQRQFQTAGKQFYFALFGRRFHFLNSIMPSICRSSVQLASPPFVRCAKNWRLIRRNNAFTFLAWWQGRLARPAGQLQVWVSTQKSRLAPLQDFDGTSHLNGNSNSSISCGFHTVIFFEGAFIARPAVEVPCSNQKRSWSISIYYMAHN